MTLPAPDALGSASPSTSALPSLEALISNENVRVTDNKKHLFRLYWTLDGPLETAISVMATSYYDPDAPESAREPYARATSDGGVPTWHPVSKESITHPPVSSVVVSVREFQDWDEAWMIIHEGHSSPSEGGPGWGPAPPPASGVALATDRLYFLRCCGEDRPWYQEDIKLTVRPSGDLVTIHDYVSQVHPWLMGMRQELVDASTCVHGNGGDPFPPDTQFMVLAFSNCVSVLPKEEWAAECSEKMVAPCIVPYPQPSPLSWGPYE